MIVNERGVACQTRHAIGQAQAVSNNTESDAVVMSHKRPPASFTTKVYGA
jgi:hypothetical protein